MKADELKSIKISDYLLAQNYSIDKKKSTLNSMLLENQSGEKVIVTIGKNLYFNPNDAQDKGDIIQLVANRLHGYTHVTHQKEDYYQAMLALKNFSGQIHDVDMQERIHQAEKFVQKKELLKNLQGQTWNHHPMTNFSYLLQERKIEKSTLEHPLFKDRLFNTYFKNQESEHLICNYGFGKYKNNELVGMEVCNRNFKNVLGDHEGLFISNTAQVQDVKYVFYAESALDVLAYFEVLQQNKNFNTQAHDFVFVSFGGNIYPSKIDSFLKEIQNLPLSPSCKFISITDNDLDKVEQKKEGKKYDFLISAALANHFGTKLAYSTENPLYYTLTLEVEQAKKLKIDTLVAKQNQSIDQLNWPSTEKFGMYLIAKKQQEQIQLLFPKKLPLEENGFTDFIEKVNKNLYISHKAPKHKDWNDYIIEKKNQVFKQNTVETPKPVKEISYGIRN
ncbi:hypothetical protein Q361_11723 [Flavobacterium croceum DSM 17960]|uniref:Toprim domain-containing protein n=1 Tax=Flavobacterium croceum DSM 17960 TaxID=1121886 RepID=A0A2S4N5H7_9FLAO|nr:hypothetical protein [Flavobacterium croceum]POS00920.1 hypothetical protein Q361_11723 [Flavobacterium croceum DSM 17960]